MKQAALNLNLSIKKTRKQVFLEQMDQVVPWAALVELIAPYYPEGRTGRPPFSLLTMLRIHFMQQWFTLSDPGMQEAFFDTPLYPEFAQLEEFARLPDESTAQPATAKIASTVGRSQRRAEAEDGMLFAFVPFSSFHGTSVSRTHWYRCGRTAHPLHTRHPGTACPSFRPTSRRWLVHRS